MSSTQANHGGPVIAASGVRQVYRGGTTALDGVDLEIGTGLFGLLGPNGAGKSTLMRILCTLLVPTAGEVKVCGHNVVRERLAVRRLFGYLPQEFNAWRLQRVEEALDTLALLSGLRGKKQRQERIQQVLADVGLNEVADRKVKTLSGGQVRRLGVAQAMVHEPKILVVDEPTVGLDPEERLRFRRLMSELAKDRTIVLSTHIVADLGSGCRDLALLDTGKIVFRGSPEELLENAEGRIFELVTDRAGEERLAERIEIVSRTPVDGGTRLRAVLLQGEMPANATLAENATLEEGYLAFMAARGRLSEALVDVPSDESNEEAA